MIKNIRVHKGLCFLFLSFTLVTSYLSPMERATRSDTKIQRYNGTKRYKKRQDNDALSPSSLINWSGFSSPDVKQEVRTLFRAINDDHPKTIKHILKLNPSLINSSLPFMVDYHYTTIPLLHWTLIKNPALVPFMIKKGATMSATYQGCNALMSAAQHGYFDLVKLLLSYNIKVNCRNDQGLTALMVATQWPNNTAIISLLLDAGAAIDEQDKNGDTALLWAVRTGCCAAVTKLLEEGAQVNIANTSGQTPLMIAALLGSYTICQKLLERGADPLMNNEKNATALDYALSVPHDNREPILTLLHTHIQRRQKITRWVTFTSTMKS